MPPTAHRSTSIFLPELSDAVIDLIVEAFGDAPPRSSASWSAYDGAVARIPIEASAFPLRGTGFGTGISLFWVAPEEREHAVTWVDRLGGALRPHGRGAYVNTLGNEGESRVREAYGSNYERLAQLKKKYDPTNLFQLNQNVTPAA